VLLPQPDSPTRPSVSPVFNGLSDLKEHMRTDVDATPLLISDRLKRIRKAGSRNDKLSDNFELEIQATHGVL
jgi:hypothetical protein